MASFGIEGIQSFANLRAAMSFPKDKVGDLTYVYNVCNGLDESLRDAGHYRKFYWGDQACWEIDMRDTSQGGIDNQWADDVSLFFIDTHGGYWGAQAHLGYDIEINKWISDSGQWRLGNNWNLEWLLVYGCQSININNPPEAWGVFQRLHMQCGAYATMYDYYTTDECGEDVGDNLTDGETVVDSWIDGVSDWYVDNHPMVLAIEGQGSFNGGNFLWHLTTMNRDHLWGHGFTCSDITPSNRYWMSWCWAEG